MFYGQELLSQRAAAQLTQISELAQEALALLVEVGVIGRGGFSYCSHITTIYRAKTMENRKTDVYLVHPRKHANFTSGR